MRKAHPWDRQFKKQKLLVPTHNELEALKRVQCGYRTRNHGFLIVCTYPVIHVGPHEGATK